MSETVENNKLIAEFMGLEAPYELPQHGYITGGGNWKDTFSAEQLRYSHSWDWLMPVFKKCMEIALVPITIYEVDIKKVYQEVVDLILDYNQKQQ